MLYRSCAFIGIFLSVAALGSAQCLGPVDLEHAIKTAPSANTYEALGAWFARRRQFACAIPAFDHALQLSPNSWETHFNIGLALMENNDEQRALTEFRFAVKLKPDSVRARSALGAALQGSKRFEEAEDEFSS